MSSHSQSSSGVSLTSGPQAHREAFRVFEVEVKWGREVREHMAEPEQSPRRPALCETVGSRPQLGQEGSCNRTQGWQWSVTGCQTVPSALRGSRFILTTR